MPKFGQAWYDGNYFGEGELAPTNFKNSIKRAQLGQLVRKSVDHRVIFRVRRGNGQYGSVKGELYQDKYKYTLPFTAQPTTMSPERRQLQSAVEYWQNVVSENEKEVYRTRATKGLRMSGYNLFMREALTGVYSMFTDRGDPGQYDFTLTDFAMDNAWHDLDLSGIIPSIARAILVDVDITFVGQGIALKFRKNGNTQDFNHQSIDSFLANVERHKQLILIPDANGVIEYNGVLAIWAGCGFTVCGWWTGG